MAESTLKVVETGAKETGNNTECAVCLQTCIHPAQLPCGHIFCFLCVKGIANQSKRCAMCRQEIPRDFLEHPKLLDSELKDISEAFEGGYQWFYEGRNGWWKYDERTNSDIETVFNSGIGSTEILICGELYVIDLVQNLQYPKRNPSRKRFIKRDVGTLPSKGVAGVPLHPDYLGWWQYDERTSRELEASYKAGERTCELLIAGFLYVADFDSMIQRRRNDPARRRRIKRDLSTIPKKGIAGIKLTEESPTADRPESPTNTCPTPPVTPAEVPHTPTESELRDDMSSIHESLQSTIVQMQALSLREDSSDSEEDDTNSNMYIFSRRFLDNYRNEN